MKKSFIILLLILAGASALILALMGNSGPGAQVIARSRSYEGVSAIAVDTFRLAVPLSTMEFRDGYLYAYVDKTKAFIRYDPEKRITDTLLYTRRLLPGILSGVALDPVGAT